MGASSLLKERDTLLQLLSFRLIFSPTLCRVSLLTFFLFSPPRAATAASASSLASSSPPPPSPPFSPSLPSHLSSRRSLFALVDPISFSPRVSSSAYAVERESSQSLISPLAALMIVLCPYHFSATFHILSHLFPSDSIRFYCLMW